MKPIRLTLRLKTSRDVARTKTAAPCDAAQPITYDSGHHPGQCTGASDDTASDDLRENGTGLYASGICPVASQHITPNVHCLNTARAGHESGTGFGSPVNGAADVQRFEAGQDLDVA